MTTQEALKILTQAARSVQANGATHDKIREALVTISKSLDPKEEDKLDKKQSK